MKAKHLMKGVWGAAGGALMGSFYGFVGFTLLAAAGVIAGTVGSFFMVAALPMLIFGAREAVDNYHHSIQNARDPVDPKIMEKLRNPPGPIQSEPSQSKQAQLQTQNAAPPQPAASPAMPQTGRLPGFVNQLNAERATAGMVGAGVPGR